MSSSSSMSTMSSRTASSRSRSQSQPVAPLFPLHRLAALSALAFIVFLGTSYSLIHDTALDTSNPLLASLPHPNPAYFAQKTNIFNTLFVKNAWGWTTAAFFGVWWTSPREIKTLRRVGGWATATGLWVLFTMWFFGPGLFDRLITASGGECVVGIPSTPGSPYPYQVIPVPSDLCELRSYITPATHPDLFADPSFVSLLGGERLSARRILHPRSAAVIQGARRLGPHLPPQPLCLPPRGPTRALAAAPIPRARAGVRLRSRTRHARHPIPRSRGSIDDGARCALVVDGVHHEFVFPYPA